MKMQTGDQMIFATGALKKRLEALRNLLHGNWSLLSFAIVVLLLIGLVSAFRGAPRSSQHPVGEAIAAPLPPSSQTPVDARGLEAIKAAVAGYTKNRYVPDEVRATPVPGIFEVRVRMEIFYTDATGRFAFVENHLIDLESRQDLTQTRLDQIASINFKELPLDLALKKVQGNGKRIVAVFEDPHCPICRSFHQFLRQLPDVTIYTFAYPIISAESDAAAKAAWCAEDRQAAWENLVVTGTAPVSKQCATPIGEIVALGQRLGVRGTPTVFFGSGRRVHGALPPDQFVAMLDQWGTVR
jgi:thiol:disulfide interchange protein DsbC